MAIELHIWVVQQEPGIPHRHGPNGFHVRARQDGEQDDCRREGFPDFTPDQFIEFLAQHYGVHPKAEINRIEFKRVE